MVYPRMGIQWCIMAPFMKLGASLTGSTRPWGVNPRRKWRFVVSFDSESVTVHTIAPFVTRRHLLTGLMKPKFKSSKCFFTGQAPLSWATPVTLPRRRTSPIASASLKITYAFSREPCRRIHIPPCVSRRPLPCFCHSTSIRDLVPRRQWTHRIQKAIVSPEILPQPPPSKPLQINTTTTPT
jgi:hypothetical protein